MRKFRIYFLNSNFLAPTSAVIGEYMKRSKRDTPTVFDYKDVKTLMRFINSYGQIEPIGRTGLSAKQQRSLAVAIKRARHLALMPFVVSN